MRWPVVDVAPDEAIRLVRENAWGYGSELLIHVYNGVIGFDAQLYWVEEQIRQAQRVAWVNHWMGHDLAVASPEGRVLHVEVHRPERAA